MTTCIVCTDIYPEQTGTFAVSLILPSFWYDQMGMECRFISFYCHASGTISTMGGQFSSLRTGLDGHTVPTGDLYKGFSYRQSVLM